jgi:uncharacterized RDD family membrane protein YckC
MRCPKCQYISFDSGSRCRNCGYDFSFSEVPEVADAPDLPIQNGSEPLGPFTELTLRDSSAAVPASSQPSDDFEPERSTRASMGRSAASGLDLPLFRDRAAGAKSEAAVVTPPTVPRAPLSVRRATPVIPKPRPRRPEAASAEEGSEPRLALDTDTGEMPAAVSVGAPMIASETGVAMAPIAARLVGGAIDLAIMSGIDIVVLYFTLKICELGFGEWSRLPLAPLVAFLLLLNGGYLATFVAAGGQTIGKMTTGIRVIPGDPDAGPSGRVPLGQAIVRAACYGISVLLAGLGFLPGLIGPEYRALHDRLADTRVVKA